MNVTHRDRALFVYLVHLSHEVGNENHTAQHYVGATRNPYRRLDDHRRGEGAALLRHASKLGIDYDLAEIWTYSGWDDPTTGDPIFLGLYSGKRIAVRPFTATTGTMVTGAFALERQLKSRHSHKKLCPVCRGTANTGE
jgi:hypothetical protein